MNGQPQEQPLVSEALIRDLTDLIHRAASTRRHRSRDELETASRAFVNRVYRVAAVHPPITLESLEAGAKVRYEMRRTLDRTPLWDQLPDAARQAEIKATRHILDAALAHSSSVPGEGLDLEQLAGDVGIRIGELLNRAGLESAPERLWSPDKHREEAAWLKGRDDTCSLIAEEIDGYIANAFEAATEKPETSTEETG